MMAHLLAVDSGVEKDWKHFFLYCLDYKKISNT